MSLRGCLLRAVSFTAVLGCRPATAPEPPPQLQERKPPACSAEQRTANACEVLRQARLFDASGMPIAAELVSCGQRDDVEWRLEGATAGRYRAIVTFGPEEEREGPRPVRVAPFLIEWPPLERLEREPRKLVLSTTRACGRAETQPIDVQLELRPLDAAACAFPGALLRGNADWCTRAPAAPLSYAIREWWWIGHKLRRAQVDIDGELATVTLETRTYSGPTRRVTRVAAGPVRELFDPVWGAASEIREGCRDGGLSVIEARRAGAWKLLLRQCRTVVDWRALAALAAGEPAGAEGH